MSSAQSQPRLHFCYWYLGLRKQCSVALLGSALFVYLHCGTMEELQFQNKLGSPRPNAGEGSCEKIAGPR